jgi:hypothetical protein
MINDFGLFSDQLGTVGMPVAVNKKGENHYELL